MNTRQLSAVLIGLLGAIALGLLVLLFRTPPAVRVEKRLTDIAAETAAGTLKNTNQASISKPKAEAAVDMKGRFARFDGKPGPASSNWPWFRGAAFDNVAPHPSALAERWPDAGPPVVWTVHLSEGHGGPAVWNGSVYLMDYMEAEECDAVRCFSLADGKEIWRHSYRSPTKRNHGVSRTVPALTTNHIVTIGPRCHVVCLDRESGTYQWGLDLAKDFGTEVPLWYTGQCPFIDAGVVVLAPAGKQLFLGVDCATGQKVWETPNPDGWKMSHSSVVPVTLLGQRMYVYCAIGGIAAVAADGPQRGEVLWKSTAWTQSVLAPSPVAIDDHRLFLTAGYGGGSLLLAVRKEGGQYKVEPEYRLDKTVFSCEQQSPILYQGLLYGVLPKDAGERRAQFAALDPANGKLTWTSGMTERFGLGPFLFADGKIFLLNDTGELTLCKASSTGFEKLARARPLPGRDAWAPMALVDGRLLLRDSENLVCLDVRSPDNKPVAALQP